MIFVLGPEVTSISAQFLGQQAHVIRFAVKLIRIRTSRRESNCTVGEGYGDFDGLPLEQDSGAEF